MKLKNRFRPALEHLEDRWCPSVSVSNPNDVLYVTGDPDGALTVTQTAPGTWTVTDNGIDILPGIIANSGVNITTQGDDDAVTVNTNGDPITGSVTVNTGNGDDTVLIQNGGAALIIQTNLLIYTGNGDDQVTLSPGGTVTVGGLTLINMGPALAIGDIADINVGATLQGGLVASEVNTLNLAGDVTGQTTIVNSTASPLGPNSVTIATTSVLTGNLTITDGAGDQAVILAGTVIGNATVYQGDGINTFDLSATGLITQSLNFNGGNNDDTVSLAGRINGSATVALRSGGTNTLTMVGRVQGSLTVTGSGATNSLTFSAASIIAGNLSMTLSTGTNTVSFGGRIGGPNLSYTGGGGVDNVTYAAGAVGGGTKLTINLGSGNDVFNLASNSYATLFADGGAGLDDFNNTTGFGVHVGSTVKNFEL